MKTCKKCLTEKELSDFYDHKQTIDGKVSQCKKCHSMLAKKNYHKNINRYRHYDEQRNRFNVKRILSHKYSGIKARCTKIKKNGRIYSVYGTAFLTKEEFNQWASDTSEDFTKLYENWKNNNFANKHAPSIDRKNSNKGYSPDNMQWLPLWKNSSKK